MIVLPAWNPEFSNDSDLWIALPFQKYPASGSGNVRAMAAGVSQATVPTMAGMVGALSGVLLVTLLSRRAAREVEFLEDSLTMDH